LDGSGAREAPYIGWRLLGLTDDEVQQIHQGTLDVLQNCGVRVLSAEALDLLESGGCHVDRATNRVRVPGHLVEEAIDSAPSKVLLAARDPAHDVLLEDGRTYFTTFGQGLRVIDPYTAEVRSSTARDIADSALLADALEHVSVYTVAVAATDIPEGPNKSLCELEVAFAHTSRHVVHGEIASGEGVRRLVEMAAAIVGGADKLRERPIVSAGGCPSSPLEHSERVCEIVMECARAGIPAAVVSMVMAGGTGPVTLAGTLVTHNAEVLSGLVLHQLAAKGAPFLYGSCTTAMDMTYGTAPLGSPESGLLSAGVAALARYYALPSVVAGGWADSKLTDAQAGHEKTLTTLLVGLAGPSLVLGMGSLELGMTLSLAQLVIDDETVAMVERVVGGVRVTDETLAVDLIKEMGPGKDFLGQKHTRAHQREEQSKVGLIDRRMRGGWEKRGGKDLAQRAAERAREILETHKPEPLSPEVAVELRTIAMGEDRGKR